MDRFSELPLRIFNDAAIALNKDDSGFEVPAKKLLEMMGLTKLKRDRISFARRLLQGADQELWQNFVTNFNDFTPVWEMVQERDRQVNEINRLKSAKRNQDFLIHHSRWLALTGGIAAALSNHNPIAFGGGMLGFLGGASIYFANKDKNRQGDRDTFAAAALGYAIDQEIWQQVRIGEQGIRTAL